MKRRTGYGTGLLACLAAVSGLAAAAPTSQSIEQIMQKAIDTFEAPGMSLSVVYDGQVFYAGGVGVTEVGKSTPVDEQTLFQIGSVSKAFTAALLATLVDEGKLDWDDPVIDYLPEFRMHDPWVTREFTVRDLLTHRSGLPLGAGDLLIFPKGNATVDDVVHALRYLEPSTSFRSQFDYDNLLYIVAGEVAARITGESIHELIETRLLAPLGMNDCAASVERTAATASLATPHVPVDGKLETTDSQIGEVVAAAGGINCSADSMTSWMRLMLNGGEMREGERLVSDMQFAQLVAPVTLLPAPGYLVEHADAYLNAYALGWGVSTFHGEPILSHGGGVVGMTTFIAVMPEQKLAVFASNNQMSAAPRAAVYDVLEQFLAAGDDAPTTDWTDLFDDLVSDRQSAADEAVAAAWAARDADSQPSLPLARYTGIYRDEWYGTIRIREDDGGLWFESDRSPALQGPLEHFQHDTFVAHWTDRRLQADAYVSFSLKPDGNVERISMQAVSPATDFSFDFHDLDLRPVAGD